MIIFTKYVFRFLIQSPGFSFEPRSKDDLPKEMPPDTEGTCYFLEDYKHSSVESSKPLDAHIQAALVEYGISSTL